jgi:hypothetical protein
MIRKEYLGACLKGHRMLEELCEKDINSLEVAIQKEDDEKINDVAYDLALLIKEINVSAGRVRTGLRIMYSYLEGDEIKIDDKSFSEADNVWKILNERRSGLLEKVGYLEKKVIELQGQGKQVYCVSDYAHITDPEYFDKLKAKKRENAVKETMMYS